MASDDRELEAVLALDGYTYRFAEGYRVKIEAKSTAVTAHRRQGVKYRLTLHDQAGRRIYGMDNAHGVRRRDAFDHRYLYGARKAVPYDFGGPARLIEDFYREVERIIAARGTK
jgi:hypothetical protein